jgi:hypothetical protein
VFGEGSLRWQPRPGGSAPSRDLLGERVLDPLIAQLESVQDVSVFVG